MHAPDDSQATPPRHAVLLLDGGPMPLALQALGARAVSDPRDRFDAVVLPGPQRGLAQRLGAGLAPEPARQAWKAETQTQLALLEGLAAALPVILRETLETDPAAALAPLIRRGQGGMAPDTLPPDPPTGPHPEALAMLVLAQDEACLTLARRMAARCGAPALAPDAALAEALAQWAMLAEAAARGRAETSLARAAHEAECRRHARSQQRARAREAALGRRLLEEAPDRQPAASGPDAGSVTPSGSGGGEAGS